jgi:hypothetical protein
LLAFFWEAAPTELISTEIARTVGKLLMLLFALEISIAGSSMGSFGEYKLLGRLWKR